MKLLFENWRKYLKEEKIDPEIIQIIEDLVGLPIRRMYLHEDSNILVQLDDEYSSEALEEIHSYWQNSDQLDKIQKMGYNGTLASRSEVVREPIIPFTKDLL